MDSPKPLLPKPFISTHVLDTSRGQPAAGIRILLHRFEEKWELVNMGTTSFDGRCDSFVTKENYITGLYRFSIDVGQYYKLLGIETLFTMIEVVFKVEAGDNHYHIPLLLSPFGYSVYKGT